MVSFNYLTAKTVAERAKRGKNLVRRGRVRVKACPLPLTPPHQGREDV